MIRNLNTESLTQVNSRYLIIGGGTSGLILGSELAKLKIGEVIILEAGGLVTVPADEIFPTVKFLRSIYQGAISGRFGGIGGTSARWGGAMLPFIETDFSGEFKDLMLEASKFVPRVEEIFSIPPGPYECADLINVPNYTVRKAKWPKFSKRNVASLLSREINKESNLIIYTNAKVIDIKVQDTRIVSLDAINANFDTFTFSAEDIIVCAGAIETTRMVLKLIAKTEQDLIESILPTTGKYFSDHLSVKIGTLVPKSRKKLNKLVGYRFESRGSMSNIRFELDKHSSLRKIVPPHFIHISFDLSSPGGFDTLREILRNLQEQKIPSIILFARLVRYLPWFFRAVWWRFVTKRLLYPNDAEIEMHLVMEQFPSPENRIFLEDKIADNSITDNVVISWGISTEDHINLSNIVELVKESFQQSELANLAKLEFLSTNSILEALDFGGGIFHPTGSTRFSLDNLSGTVDSNLRVVDFDNLYLLSTSVLSFGGGSNPTMTQLMLGLRLAKHLEENAKLN